MSRMPRRSWALLAHERAGRRLTGPQTRADHERSGVFVIVSRQVLLDSNFSTVVCTPSARRRRA